MLSQNPFLHHGLRLEKLYVSIAMVDTNEHFEFKQVSVWIPQKGCDFWSIWIPMTSWDIKLNYNESFCDCFFNHNAPKNSARAAGFNLNWPDS